MMNNNNQNPGPFARPSSRSPPVHGAYAPNPFQHPHPSAYNAPMYAQHPVLPGPGPQAPQPMVPYGYQHPAPIQTASSMPRGYDAGVPTLNWWTQPVGVPVPGIQYDAAMEDMFAHHPGPLNTSHPPPHLPVVPQNHYWSSMPAQPQEQWRMQAPAMEYISQAQVPPPVQISAPETHYQDYALVKRHLDEVFGAANSDSLSSTKTPATDPTPLPAVPLTTSEQHLAVPSPYSPWSPIYNPLGDEGMLSSPASSSHGSAGSFDVTDEGNSTYGSNLGSCSPSSNFTAEFSPPRATCALFLPASTSGASTPHSSSSGVLPPPSLAESATAPRKARKPRKTVARSPTSPNFGNRTRVYETKEAWAAAHLDSNGDWKVPKRATKAQILDNVKESLRKDEMFICGCGSILAARTIKEKHRKWEKPKICGVDGCRMELTKWPLVRHQCTVHNKHPKTKCTIRDEHGCVRYRRAQEERARKQGTAGPSANMEMPAEEEEEEEEEAS